MAMGGAARFGLLAIVAAVIAPAPAHAGHPGRTATAEPVIAADGRRHGEGPAALLRLRERRLARAQVRRDRVVLSWFSVASMAAAIDGHVVLLDTYIHKGEDRPNYVPTTTNELVALAPEAIFIGHGHFDHANTGGEIAARTGAAIVGTPEHCDQAKEQATSVARPDEARALRGRRGARARRRAPR